MINQYKKTVPKELFFYIFTFFQELQRQVDEGLL